MPRIINLPKIPPIKEYPSSYFPDILNHHHDDDEYERSLIDAGLVVIFNQQSYEDDSYTNRKGTNKDVNELILTFGRLGFKMEEKYIFNDLKRTEIIGAIKSLSEEDHSQRNCLVIIVLTHGEENNILQAHDAPVYAYEFWEPFADTVCRSLKDKPKFFIFQACKGENFSTSVTNAGNIIPETTFKNPIESDMLIAFSSVEGGKSCRNPINGTWFIQELCRNLNAYARRDDVVSLLLRVSKCIVFNYYHELEDENSSDKIVIKQMPILISTLSKKFYLSNSKDRKMISYLKRQQQLIINNIQNICEDKIKQNCNSV